MFAMDINTVIEKQRVPVDSFDYSKGKNIKLKCCGNIVAAKRKQ
jgi:hypothetical protein